MRCCKSDWPAFFVLLLSTLVCSQQTELIWVFLYYQVSNFTPPPPPGQVHESGEGHGSAAYTKVLQQSQIRKKARKLARYVGFIPTYKRYDVDGFVQIYLIIHNLLISYYIEKSYM